MFGHNTVSCGSNIPSDGADGLPPSDIRGDDEENSAFVPTYDELKLIVEYYINRILEYDYDLFLYCQTSSCSNRFNSYAAWRLKLILGILGEEKFWAIRNNVLEEFGKKRNPRHWDVFLNGSEEQWDEIREEVDVKTFGSLRMRRLRYRFECIKSNLSSLPLFFRRILRFFVNR